MALPSFLTTGLTTGLSPAQQVDIAQYYNTGEQTLEKQDNTLLYIAIFAAILVAGASIYFITKN
jgi:hypothetical protein